MCGAASWQRWLSRVVHWLNWLEGRPATRVLPDARCGNSVFRRCHDQSRTCHGRGSIFSDTLISS